MVLAHPHVIGELALGQLRQRQTILNDLADLPSANVAAEDEVFRFIDENKLYGSGIGYIDAHLLAAVRLTPGTSIWTKDRRLLSVAKKLSLAARLSH